MALQLQRISLRERGRIDAEAFRQRGRQEAGENSTARRAIGRISVLRGQCEKPI
jgi:hypothetical protein